MQPQATPIPNTTPPLGGAQTLAWQNQLGLLLESTGDGIMSAIDFSMDIKREPNDKGDRVSVVLSGKFLPYKTY